MAATFNITTAAEKLKTYTPEQLAKMQKAVQASGNKAAIDQFASALAQSKTGVKTPIETFQDTPKKESVAQETQRISGSSNLVSGNIQGGTPAKSVTVVSKKTLPDGKVEQTYSDGTSEIITPDTSGSYSSQLGTGGYTHVYGETGNTVSWTPTKTIGTGVAYNEKGTTDMERLGLTSFQVKEVNKYLQNLGKDGIPDIEKTKLTQEYIKLMQKDNADPAKYGTSYGNSRATVPTDPTKEKGSIENNIDLNNNGIPDNQETTGLKDTTTPSKVTLTVTDPVTGKPKIDPVTGKPKTYEIDTTNFNDLEKTVATWKTDMSSEEIAAKKRAADAENAVTNASAKKIIDLNNGMVGNINALLDERIQANKDQYSQAVGNVYRTLGGQAKALQRIIGSDGVPMDDATMISLMGEQGVESMSNIVDLKNKLVNDYIAQKQKAIEDIYKLQKENVITENDAAAAVQAVNARTESDVIDLTKTFYKEMFGLTEAVDAAAEQKLSGIRSALGTYMTSLGITGEQQTKIINDYVKKGYSVEEAQRKLIDDINSGNSPIPADLLQNKADAAAAAQAKLQEDMAKLLAPITEKGRIDAILQDDKQEFEAEQNALDRKIKASMAARASGVKPKPLTDAQKANATLIGNQPGIKATPNFTSTGTQEDLDLIRLSLSRIANGNNSPTDIAYVESKYDGLTGLDSTKAQTMLDKIATTAAD